MGRRATPSAAEHIEMTQPGADEGKDFVAEELLRLDPVAGVACRGYGWTTMKREPAAVRTSNSTSLSEG